MWTGGSGALDAAQALPAGWVAVEDASSSTGRVYYKNTVSGATQRERPTCSAQATAPKRGARLAPTAPVAVELSEAEKAAKAERAAAQAALVAAAQANAAEEAAAEAAQARAVALRLVQESSAAEARGAQGGVRVVSVASLLEKAELQHYGEAFAAAGVDDAALEEIVAIVNDDAVEGAEEVERLITECGVRGGAAVKLRRALATPPRGGHGGEDVAGVAGGGSGRGGGGRGGGRGGGKKLSKKEKAAAAAAQKRDAAAVAKKLEKARVAQAACARRFLHDPSWTWPFLTGIYLCDSVPVQKLSAGDALVGF